MILFIVLLLVMALGAFLLYLEKEETRDLKELLEQQEQLVKRYRRRAESLTIDLETIAECTTDIQAATRARRAVGISRKF